MIISCSSAVWKCQGTTHLGGAFRIKVERPVVGSPVSTADNRHFTSLSGENFTDKSGLMLPVAVFSARVPRLGLSDCNPKRSAQTGGSILRWSCDLTGSSASASRLAVSRYLFHPCSDTPR